MKSETHFQINILFPYFDTRLNRFFELIYFFYYCYCLLLVKMFEIFHSFWLVRLVVVPSLRAIIRVQVIASDYFSARLNVTLYFLCCLFFFSNFYLQLPLSLARSLTKGAFTRKSKKAQECMRLCPLNTVN